MPSTSSFTSAAAELRLRLRGGLHAPGDPAYDETCTLFNAMVDRRPRAVARCAAPDDVIAALAFARSHNLPVAVRAGGHSVTGASLVDDGLVLDVRPMADVTVDPLLRVARVGGGATWAAVDRATGRFGLATTGGRVSTTGVAGLTLGGGSGWLERKHGLACDNLVAVELVTADGRLVRASNVEHPDLFWALRGGGAGFGVVTAFEFALHPVEREVLAGLVVHSADRAREVVALWRDTMRDAPEGLSLACMLLTGPDEPEIPAELRGRPVVALAGMYAGSVADGKAALRDVRAFGPPAADLFAPAAYADFQCSLDDPPGFRNWWTAQHLADLPDAAIDVIADAAAELPPGPAQLFLAAWGGAVARVGQEASPLACRDATYVVHPLFMWEDPADDDRMIGLGRRIREQLDPFAAAGPYLNFIGDEGEDRRRAAFGPAYERLAAVRRCWDPDGVFAARTPAPIEAAA